MNTMLLRYFQTAVACISIAAILTPSPASSAALHRSHVERTTYMGFPAYRITDGHTEAVAAPAIGRIMRFGLAAISGRLIRRSTAGRTRRESCPAGNSK